MQSPAPPELPDDASDKDSSFGNLSSTGFSSSDKSKSDSGKLALKEKKQKGSSRKKHRRIGDRRKQHTTPSSKPRPPRQPKQSGQSRSRSDPSSAASSASNVSEPRSTRQTRQTRHSRNRSDHSSAASSTSNVSANILDVDSTAFGILDELATDIDYCPSDNETIFDSSHASEKTEATSDVTSEATSEPSIHEINVIDFTEANPSTSNLIDNSSVIGSSKPSETPGENKSTSSNLTTKTTKRKQESWTKRPKKSKVSAESKPPDEDIHLFDSVECLEVPVEPISADVLDHINGEIVSSLTPRLPEGFFVEKIGSSVKLFCLTKSHNATVEKSVFWDSGIVRFYVYGLLVPKNHEIYDSNPIPQEITVDSITEHLLTCVRNLMNYFVCKGIHEFECLWGRKGHTDNILVGESKSFRSLECEILVTTIDTVCAYCKDQLRNFRKDMQRNEDRDVKKVKHIPNKFLSEREKEEKLLSQSRKIKKEKRRNRRLKKRLDAKEGYVKLDTEFQKDLFGVLKKNEHKMTDAMKIFWNSQMNALKVDNRKNVKWHPLMIRIALCLKEVTTNEGYETFREFIVLPSSRRLYDYSHVIQAKEGCQEEILNDVVNEMHKSGAEEHFKYVNLMCDEIHIRSGVVLRRSTGELIGYTNLCQVEEELLMLSEQTAKKTYEPKLAKKALVFLAKGITSGVHSVVAIFSVDELSAPQLFTRSWDVIYNLEEAGLKVLAYTFDGAAVNRKFVEMHKKLDAPPPHEALKPLDIVHATLNIASGEEKRPMYFILDPPHFMKTARNCFANSFRHKKTRTLCKNGENISWTAIEKVHEVTSAMKFKEHKLTLSHIRLNAFSCMKVIYAIQVWSDSVVNCLRRYKSHPSFKDEQLDELIKLVGLMNHFFDILNSKEDRKKSADGEEELKSTKKKGFTSENDERFDFLASTFLKFFDDWKKDVMRKPGLTKKEKARMLLSHQTLHAMKITVYSFIGAIKYMLKIGAPKVDGRVFNQDPVEQFFSKARRSTGDNNNPSLKDLQDFSIRQHIVGNLSVASSRGNTKAEKREIIVDDTPLPALKRAKKQ